MDERFANGDVLTAAVRRLLDQAHER